MATQAELRKHCIEAFGMTDEEIGEEEIPQCVLLLRLDKRPLTEAEEKWARELVASVL
ncbi:hypothetical protein LCGC14_2332260 [marine sediment metagenome]|uniref:Uncharacterized protein n=1 Tax=marine sediment metagenome TaxID=412755 RepID=A0A0F9F9J3_9ZZZZ